MKVLIVEDEASARDFLVRQIQKANTLVEIVAMVDSVQSAVEWFTAYPHPDIAFFDIQLSDGLSFEIFEKVEVLCPVIFTTAYEEYAIKAFKVNSIDYLLKPIDVKELAKALDKYKSIWGTAKVEQQNELTLKVSKIVDLLARKHKERFLVNVGIHLRTLDVVDICCFFSLEKSTFIVDTNGKHYAVEYSLDRLENLVNPNIFFRVDRKYLVNRNFIYDIVAYSSNRLKIKLRGYSDEDVVVSRKRVADFKKWLEL